MPLSRVSLVAYRSASVTPDVAEALRQAERATLPRGARLLIKASPQPEARHLSLVPAGREVRVQLTLNPKPETTVELALLWGILLPLGFTPKNRYPVPGPDDDVYHFLGPWQGLLDHLCGEGLGGEAWPSLSCAAQVDAGVWEGDRPIERFVQAQLHRLGLHCGPVDGIVTERVSLALRALGVSGMTLEETAAELGRYRVPPVDVTERRFGHIVVPGDDLTVVSYGKVLTTRTAQGVALTVDGPGRVILTIGNGEA